MRRCHKIKKYIKDRGYYGLYVVAILPDGEDGPASPIKIGISDDPITRLSALQMGSFFKLVVYQHWWLAGKLVAVNVERAFKDKYREFNIRGEWFDLEPNEAVKLAAQQLSDIGPRFYTEASLIEKMRKEALKEGQGMNFGRWREINV